MNAAGVLGMSPPILKRVYDSGAGGVVTKSVGPVPRKGHQNPTLVRVSCGALNAMGLPNPGADYYAEEIKAQMPRPALLLCRYTRHQHSSRKLSAKIKVMSIQEQAILRGMLWKQHWRRLKKANSGLPLLQEWRRLRQFLAF